MVDDHDQPPPLDPIRAAAIQQLIACADQVGRASGREPGRKLLRWLSRGRWGRRTGWPVVPHLSTPWQDTISNERPGWRMRAAHLRGPDGEDLSGGEHVFAVDYETCATCRVGWVEQPYTLDPYQRRGLAAAGLAQLRAEHPGYAWHTLGDHMNDARAFWNRVGADVPGGYRPRWVCPHITP